MCASALFLVKDAAPPLIYTYRYGLSGSMMDRATVGVRRRFLSLTRPLAVLMRTWRPSQSNHTGVTWGVLSAFIVARLAKAFLVVRRSLNASGIAFMGP